MVDTPSDGYGLRLQELGTNVATWGDPNLNQLFTCVDQMFGTVKGITVTGNYTITSTNYVSTADNKNAGWSFNGTLAAASNVIVPATNTRFHFENATTGGFSLTAKTSAGTGITVPAGRIAYLRCDGTNVVNAFPTHMGTTFTPSLPGDVANVSYVQAAIATASLPATAGTVLVSGSDTTAGYISTKIAGAGALSVAVTNPGANETLTLSVGSLGLTDGGTISGASAVAVNTKYLCDFTATSYTVTLPAAPAVGDMILLTKFGTGLMTLDLNGLDFNGLSNNPVSSGEGQSLLRYTGATRGWVEL